MYSSPSRLGRPTNRQKNERRQKDSSSSTTPENVAPSNSYPEPSKASRISVTSSSTSPLPADISDEQVNPPPVKHTGQDELCLDAASSATTLAACTSPHHTPSGEEGWASSLTYFLGPNGSMATPDFLNGNPANLSDETWAEFLDDGVASKMLSSLEQLDAIDPSLTTPPLTSASSGATVQTRTCPTPKGMEHVANDRNNKANDPIPVLTQIQLQLHEISASRARQPQHGSEDWQEALGQTVQGTQRFLQVLHQLIPRHIQNPDPVMDRQRQHHSLYFARPSRVAQMSPFDRLSDFNHDWQSTPLSQPQTYPSMPSTGGSTVDTVVIRLALICHIQILRNYNDLIHNILDSLSWTDTTGDPFNSNDGDLQPIIIGKLQASVSPQLHISLLAQLISQHADELCYKMRMLISWASETDHDAIITRPGGKRGTTSVTTELVGRDICNEEEYLRDGIDQIMKRLKDYWRGMSAVHSS